MKVDADTKQRLCTFLSMGLEFYKVIMGTFLTVFVPQQCKDAICTMSQNFFNGSMLNTLGNVSNFLTFVSIGSLYYIELKRENWCIRYLDIDDDKCTTNLDTEIEAYPKYKQEMSTLNKYYIISVYFSLFMMIANFIISGIVVYQSYTGINSITTFVSFFLLVFMKLYSSWTVGALSIKYERANSAYMKEPKTFNTIDSDYKIDDTRSENHSTDVIVEEKNDDILSINDEVENKDKITESNESVNINDIQVKPLSQLD